MSLAVVIGLFSRRAVEIPERSKRDVAERVLDEVVVGMRARKAHSSRETGLR